MLEEAEDRRRQREAEQARRLAQLRERREEARRELERRADAERRRAEARRAEEERRSRLLDEAEQRRREREEEQRRRLAELRERREAARRRLAERAPADGNGGSGWWDRTRGLFGGRPEEERGPPLPEKQQANRETFTRRDTTIEYTTLDGGQSTGRTNRSRQTSWKDAAAAPARNSRVATKRRTRVKQYRRRAAARRVTRCNGNAGPRITPPGVYVVKRGDSLWRIARRHYNRGSLYPVIHRANRRKIRVARLIYPCQRFRLPAIRFR